jgi:hypothetical protein
MIRVILGLFLAGGFILLVHDTREIAAQKGGNSGTISKINSKTGSIAINMYVAVKKKKKELVDKEYFLNDDAKVTIKDGGESKTYTGKEALEKGVLKEGDAVTFTPDGDLKIKELNVGGKKKQE